MPKKEQIRCRRLRRTVLQKIAIARLRPRCAPALGRAETIGAGSDMPGAL
jgi:hypothetical protein